MKHERGLDWVGLGVGFGGFDVAVGAGSGLPPLGGGGAVEGAEAGGWEELTLRDAVGDTEELALFEVLGFAEEDLLDDSPLDSEAEGDGASLDGPSARSLEGAWGGSLPPPAG